MDAKFTLVKNQNSISFRIEEAALLLTDFALFTSFFWKYLQIFIKRDKESTHAWFSKIVEDLQVLLAVSEVLNIFEYHILYKQDSKKQICNLLV